MINTQDLPSYIPGYDEYCEPEEPILEHDFYDEYRDEKMIEEELKKIENSNSDNVIETNEGELMEDLQLIDIADDLVILNRNTIETLFHLDKASDCIALYVLYYRLAKWQKTNQIRALDSYVCKTLKWGKDKTTKIKKILKEQGLIELIQNRRNGKIDSWLIKINYIISEKKIDGLKFEINNLPVTENSVTDFATSCSQDIIALRNNINCLKNKNKLLEEENNKLKSLLKENGSLPCANMETYKEIINYMNTVNEHHRFNIKIPFSYKANSKATQKLINARLKEGYDIEEFKDVIWWGYRKFVENEFKTQNGESSYKYFRPSTLFSSEHFEEYLNEYRANTQ